MYPIVFVHTEMWEGHVNITCHPADCIKNRPLNTPTDAAKAKNTSCDCRKFILEISNKHAKHSRCRLGLLNPAGPAAAEFSSVSATRPISSCDRRTTLTSPLITIQEEPGQKKQKLGHDKKKWRTTSALMLTSSFVCGSVVTSATGLPVTSCSSDNVGG